MALLPEIAKFFIKSAVTKYGLDSIEKSQTRVPKWVDIMKDRILIIKYINDNGKESNELILSSFPRGGRVVPEIQFILEDYFRNDDPLINRLRELSQSKQLPETYLALIDDYKVSLDMKTGELFFKEKMTLPERIKYKALWNDLREQYNKLHPK